MELDEDFDAPDEETFGFELEEIDKRKESHNLMVVPWLSWDEWDFVRESLFSSSPDLVDAALRRISAWRSRGCLPDAIEVTASIVEVQQRDPFYRETARNDVLNSEELLAMLYCMALLRLLNDFVEKPRNKTRNKARNKKNLSIADAAAQMGIPRVVVDIRHEGSHCDLPSLKLGRLGSEEALDWLKSYYWDPQKNAINFREEIRSKLRELEYCLSIKKVHQLDSSSKRRCTKQSELLCGYNRFYSYMTVQASKSGGSKKLTSKTLKALVRLYSSFPSEVASVLLGFLLKTSDFSVVNEVEPTPYSQEETSQGKINTRRGSTDSWKRVITTLASKRSELWVTILKGVLEMIETREVMKSAIGGEQLLPSQYSEEIYQIQHFSSLAAWLIGNYKNVKHQNRLGHADETIPDTPTEANVYPKRTLKELLTKCLLVLSPGNKQLAGCTLLLAQMVGDTSMIERLKKLSLLSFPDLDSFVYESSSGRGVEHIFQQQKVSISQAEKKLEFLKQLRMSNKVDTTEKKKNTWNLAKSWNPCPIGALPSAIDSKGSLPILNGPIDIPDNQNSSEKKEGLEMNCCSCNKREATVAVELLKDSSEVEMLGDPSVIQKANIPLLEESQEHDQYMSRVPFEDRLLIGGVWKKVARDELLEIESAIRIFV
ncbi:hypothetical protein GIB67_001800 [Kingdonia uniflora]|uniref:Ribosomal biogenesis protein LAS1L n=1 Tax=Kingdonia uniflora TaxID=39325 RepID=A0A7J7LBZ8_9MAGN|nr:hypothetical protein GIB67_001800 [Kingdonia uniflora]